MDEKRVYLVAEVGAIQGVDIPHVNREVSINPCILKILEKLFLVGKY